MSEDLTRGEVAVLKRRRGAGGLRVTEFIAAVLRSQGPLGPQDAQ